jgi:hypothetical protein
VIACGLPIRSTIDLSDTLPYKPTSVSARLAPELRRKPLKMRHYQSATTAPLTINLDLVV